jgi:hypothetical protein
MYEFQSGINSTRNWDGSLDPRFAVGEGNDIRRPQQITVTVTSTIRPNMLNEARVGLARTVSHQYSPMDDPAAGDGVKNMLQWLVPSDNFPEGYQGLPLLVGLGPAAPTSTLTLYRGNYATPSGFTFSPMGNGGINGMMVMNPGQAGNSGSHPYGTSGGSIASTYGGTDHRWTIEFVLETIVSEAETIVSVSKKFVIVTKTIVLTTKRLYLWRFQLYRRQRSLYLQ